MNTYIIEKYIKKITKKDIYNYCNNNKINITNEEIDTLYYYLKTYYHEFLTNKQSRPILFNKIKPQISEETYNILEQLYNTYKDKI